MTTAYPGKELAFQLFNAEPRRISDLPSADPMLAPTDMVPVLNGTTLAKAGVSQFTSLEIVDTFADIDAESTLARIVYVIADENNSDASVVYFKNGTDDAIELGIGEVPISPPPPGPLVLTSFLDTFTGTGGLSAHTSDSGQTWASENYWLSPTGIDDLTLSSGTLQGAGTYGGTAKIDGTFPSSGTFKFVGKIASAESNYRTQLLIGVSGTPEVMTAYEVTITAGTNLLATITPWINWEDAGGTLPANDATYVFGEEFTAHVIYTPTSISLYINNTLLCSATPSGPVSADGGQFILGFRSDTANSYMTSLEFINGTTPPGA